MPDTVDVLTSDFSAFSDSKSGNYFGVSENCVAYFQLCIFCCLSAMWRWYDHHVSRMSFINMMMTYLALVEIKLNIDDDIYR